MVSLKTGNEMMAVGQMQMRRNMRQDPALEGERSEHGNAPKQVKTTAQCVKVVYIFRHSGHKVFKDV